MAKRILIVDDELSVVELLREGLSEAGFQVDGVYDAAEALDRVKDNLYDAAIVDFALPDMNGVMLHSKIRQLDSDLGDCTLFISGQAQTDESLNYYASEGTQFISKPFVLAEVIQAVRRVVHDA
jgi:DNA-binding response OmpR family regulator